ncbi:uncharacterized protein LOC125459744 isoform X2 [Stegostoma tigrinum]|uniref:uncharacterized protein LOC125459744 isoform X2 n=1 Tax=Stegostoma tigrinum TaxID=3053191 RepID=UPI00202AFD3A|nr:uncharacterized protein LOC125459744 isoform X2 [Stegostoma tigrinum]
MSENTSEVDDATPSAKAETDKSESSPSVIATTEKSESYTRPKPEKKKVSTEKRSKHHKRPSKVKEKWGMLSPYLDKSELKCALAKPSVIQYDYKSRITANGVVEPHISFKMDNMLPDRLTKQLENWNKRFSASHKKGRSYSDRLPAAKGAKQRVTVNPVISLLLATRVRRNGIARGL